MKLPDNLINVSEKEIAKRFGIPLTNLKKKRIEELHKNTEICFTPAGSCKILYNLEKFKEWFNKNKSMAHKNYNEEIARTIARINVERAAMGLKKI